MAAVNDIIQLKLFQTLSTQDVLNVFHWRLVEGSSPISATEVAEAFVENILPTLAGVCTSTLQYQSIEAVNLAHPADFIILPNTEFGGVTEGTWAGSGGTASSFVCTTFRYERQALGQSYGFKRFAGVPENAIGTEAVVDSTYLSACQTLATVLSIPLEGDSAFYAAAVVSRPISLGTNPLNRLANGVSFRGIGSQNSRKASLRPSD